ncbi:MAG: hypothetical protein ACO3DX_01585 [Candidatus Nanopelagicales bacterium]
MLRYLSQPRWIWWHLVAIGFGYGFFRLGWWQWERRIRIDLASGEQIADWQNTFYAVQWWIFALFVVWFWWKFLADGYNLTKKASENESSS